MSLNSGETLQPFKALNQLIFDSSGNLIGIQNDRAVGNDLRIGGGSGVDGTFATLVATTALNLNSGATFDLYNTEDQTTNYERLRADWSGSVARVWTGYGGTAAARTLRLGVGSSAGATSPDAGYLQIANSATTPFAFVATSTNSGSAVGIDLIGQNYTASSGTSIGARVAPTFNQSGTAGYTALDINPTESATGSGTKLLQRWAIGGTPQAYISNIGSFFGAAITACAGGFLGIANGGVSAASADVRLERDAANTLALRFGSSSQTFRVYNTYTDGSNYRRWNLSWNTTTAIMQVVGAGTGTNGNLAVGNAALATTDTVGYFMIPSSAGAPTGVPADIPTGQVALHFDSTNNKLYVYDGGWISTAALT